MDFTYTLYWITRFDALKACLTVIAIVTLILSVVFIFVYLSSTTEREYTYDERWICPTRNKFKKGAWISLSIFAITFLSNSFIPNTKDALIITGVGETLNWATNNETIKQLPEKATLALEKWLDEQLEED